MLFGFPASKIDTVVDRIINEVGHDEVKSDISYYAKKAIDRIILEEFGDDVLFCGVKYKQVICEQDIFQITWVHIWRDVNNIKEFTSP